MGHNRWKKRAQTDNHIGSTCLLHDGNGRLWCTCRSTEKTSSHRYNPKFGKTLDDFALFTLPVVETWIIYRGANIDRRATIPNVQEEIFKHLFSKYNSPFLAGKYLTKKKRRLAEIKADDLDPIPKISKRFSKRPVSQLTRAQMYYDLGP